MPGQQLRNRSCPHHRYLGPMPSFLLLAFSPAGRRTVHSACLTLCLDSCPSLRPCPCAILHRVSSVFSGRGQFHLPLPSYCNVMCGFGLPCLRVTRTTCPPSPSRLALLSGHLINIHLGGRGHHAEQTWCFPCEVYSFGWWTDIIHHT